MGPEVDSIHVPTREEVRALYAEALKEQLKEEPEYVEKAKGFYDIAVENSIEKAFGNKSDIASDIASYKEKPTPGLIAKEFIAKINKQKLVNTVISKDDSRFMKNDSGKNMLSLIDPEFILLLGEILTFGAKKYAPNNWQLCEDTSRYKDALLRHIYAYLAGETVDPESGLSHLGHAAFGLMCLNYFDNKEQN